MMHMRMSLWSVCIISITWHLAVAVCRLAHLCGMHRTIHIRRQNDISIFHKFPALEAHFEIRRTAVRVTIHQDVSFHREVIWPLASYGPDPVQEVHLVNKFSNIMVRKVVFCPKQGLALRRLFIPWSSLQTLAHKIILDKIII